MIERFKIFKIVGREYIISSKGRVINPNSGYELEGEITPKGYKRYYFNNRTLGYKANKFGHVLVAEAFVENPNNYGEVNHIDNNRLNNKVENLEWVTRSMNVKHSFSLGNKTHKGINNPSHKHKISDNLKNKVNQQPSPVEIREGSEISQSINNGIASSEVKWGTLF
jgi:hypothetical protein